MNPTQLFQFHYGTIKSCESESGNGLFNYFNSTMVRLKGILCILKRGNWVFQFHYGTIKRKKNLNYTRRMRKFQFHYGTIKSRKLFSILFSLFNFNSTMVRLKEAGILFHLNV